MIWDFNNPFRISYSLDSNTVDPQCLHIFLVSRQIYEEASSIFYHNNVFNFILEHDNYDSVMNCLAFLRDRPQPALTRIRNIWLGFGGDVDQRVYNFVPGSSWEALWHIINQQCCIKSLRLKIVGDWSLDYEGYLLNDKACAGWKGLLVRIGGLERLEVNLRTNSDMQASIKFVKSLKAAMIKDGDKMDLRASEVCAVQYGVQLLTNSVTMTANCTVRLAS